MSPRVRKKRGPLIGWQEALAVGRPWCRPLERTGPLAQALATQMAPEEAQSTLVLSEARVLGRMTPKACARLAATPDTQWVSCPSRGSAHW